MAFGACDDPTTATQLGLYGLHLELRNKIAIHIYVYGITDKSVFLLHGDVGGSIGTHKVGSIETLF